MSPAQLPQICAILQARMSSSRLPGKVLKPILGIPMLQHQIARVQRSQRINQLVVATSDQDEDEAIAELCTRLGVACFRGSLDDVLDRYYQTSRHYPSEHVVRLTGDCPVADPEIIDAVIDEHLQSGADYTANCIVPTLPDGLDVEVFSRHALQLAWQEARLPSEREHVTLFLRNHPQRFKLADYHYPRDLSGLRWTVDNPEDFALITAFYQKLYPQNADFGLNDILALLATHPELTDINQHLERNQGLKKSLAQDKGTAV